MFAEDKPLNAVTVSHGSRITEALLRQRLPVVRVCRTGVPPTHPHPCRPPIPHNHIVFSLYAYASVEGDPASLRKAVLL